jgi:hypothetical protein
MSRIDLDVGLGEAVLVPDDVCVASTADIGAGGVDVLGGETGGVDVDWEDLPQAPDGTPRVVVDGHVGMGGFVVDHDDRGYERRWDSFDDDPGADRNPACA